MKIIKNEKLIKRNGTIGNWASLGGILLVAAPLYFYTRGLSQNDLEGLNISLLFGLTLAGIVASQVGMYYGSRYGRSPRPDEKLDAALKGLQNEFSVYHYITPASHLLVGPAGIWVLIPYHQRGQVIFTKNRWRMSGGGFLQGYMRIFGQEGIGRPDMEAEGEVGAVKKYLAKKMGESEIPDVNVMLVFTSDQVHLNAEESPIPAMKLKDIKEFFRKKVKDRLISQTQLAAVKAALPE